MAILTLAKCPIISSNQRLRSRSIRAPFDAESHIPGVARRVCAPGVPPNKIAMPSRNRAICRKRHLFKDLKWCPGAESNHRHCDFQSHALPTELPGRALFARQARLIESACRLVQTRCAFFFVAVARKIEWRGAQDRMAPRPWRSRGAIFYPAGRERYRFVRRAGPACRLSRVRGDAAPPTWPSRPLRLARAPDEIALRAELEHARLDRPGHIVAVAKSHLCQANPACAVRSCGLQGPWLARGLGFA